MITRDPDPMCCGILERLKPTYTVHRNFRVDQYAVRDEFVVGVGEKHEVIGESGPKVIGTVYFVLDTKTDKIHEVSTESEWASIMTAYGINEIPRLTHFARRKVFEKMDVNAPPTAPKTTEWQIVEEDDAELMKKCREIEEGAVRAMEIQGHP